MIRKLLFLLLMFTYVAASAVSVTYSDSNSGKDDDPVVSSITLGNLPGTTITDIQITASIGSNCPSWYWYDMDLVGTAYSDLCNITDESYSDLNGAALNGQVISISSVDADVYSDNVTLSLSVTVFYDLAGAAGTPANPSPADDATDVSSTVDLSWTNGINTENVDVYFSTTESDVINKEVTARVLNNSTATSYDPGTMTANTDYFWRVIAKNSTKSETDGAVWVFTTECGTVTNYPYTEGFEDTWSGSPSAPGCWSQITVSGLNPWLSYGSSPHGGSKCAKGPYASAGSEHLLITPEFDFGTTDYRLKFWLKGSSSVGTDLKVQIANNNSSEGNFTTELAHYVAGTNMPTTWTEYTIDLSAYENTQYIAFRLIDDDGYSLYIDDVTMEEVPSCLAPASLTETSIEINSADLGWTENNTPAATTWDIEYGETPYTFTGDATIDGTITNPHSLTGLSLDTEYTWKVRSGCGSTWAGPSTFTTTDGIATNPTPADGASGIAVTATTLDWDDIVGADGYHISVGTTTGGTEIVNNVAISGATNSTYIVSSDWNYSTTYYWTVTTNYNSTESVVGDEWDFTTLCVALTAPYTQNFDGVTSPALPNCWSVLEDAISTSAYVQNSTTSPNSAPNNAKLYNSSDASATLLLISPEFSDLTTQARRIRFFAKGGTGYNVIVGTMSDPADEATFTAFETVAIPATYTQYTVDFDATYTETDTYIAFKHGLGGTYRSIYVDDFSYEIIQAIAPNPASVSFPTDNIETLNNPLLSWSPSMTGESATGYKVYLDGNNPPTTEVYDGTDLEFQTSGLTLGTQYYWKVVPYNANGDATGVSVWSFNTVNDGYLAESFESTTFPPAGWTTPGTWLRSTSQYFVGDASAYKYSSSTENMLRTPLVTITGTSTLDFFARTSSSNTSQRIQVQYSADAVSYTDIGSEINLASAGDWTQYSIDLSSLTGNDYYLAILTYNAGSGGSVYVDHVIGPMITPMTPDAVELTSPADAAIDQIITPSLSWTAAATGGVPTGYKVYLDENANPTTLYDNVASSPYTVSPVLDYNTTYYWRVVAYNDSGDGTTSLVRSFTTMSDPTLTPPFTEDFASMYPTNWTKAQGLLDAPVTFTSTTNNWIADGFANVGTSGSAKNNIYGLARKDWMITPPINLGDGSIDYRLTFDLALTDYGSTNPPETDGVDDKFAVVISTDNGATWTSVNTLMLWDNDASANVYNNISNSGEEIIIDISSYTGIVKLAFYGESTISNADNDLFVDNVSVKEIPSCPAPINLVHSNESIVGSDLGWTDASGSHWDLYIVNSSTAAPDASTTPTVNDHASTSYAWTGGSADTQYDWYVRSDCGQDNTDVSAWTSPGSFTTLDGKATNPTPLDGVSGIAVNAKTFDWDDVVGATSYTINIGTATGLTDVLLDGVCPASTYTYTGADWDNSEDYFWTVSTVYSNGTVVGNEWEFMTECGATTVPYFENFDDVTAPEFPICMTVENTNGDSKQWKTSADGLSTPNCATIEYNSSQAMNDWFFTEGLQLTGGTTYEVSFVYSAESDSFTEKLAVDWGNAAMSTSMSGTPIFDEDDIDIGWYDGSGSFIPTTTGTYYVGFHGYSDADMYKLYVDNVKVLEVLETTIWTGGVDEDWDTEGNWNPGIPSSTTNVTIPVGLTNYPTLTSAAECNDLTIQSTVAGDGSLIESGNLTANGTVTVERYISNGQWHGISSPVAGATVQSLYSNTANVYLKSHAESTNDYTNIVDLDDPLGNMQGFMMWYAGVATGETFGITGTLRNGIVGSTDNMTRTNVDAEPDYYGWNFVGNPYSSAINWDAADGWDKTGLDATIYLYDNGSWDSWNGTLGTGGMTSGHIAMGQGFFVNVTDVTTYPSTGTLTMTNEVQVHNPVGFLKSSSEISELVRIEVSNGEYVDDAVIYFEEEATSGFDAQFDAHKLFSFNQDRPHIYSTANNFMAINALPVENTEVPFNVSGVEGEVMTISALEIIGFGDVFMLDNYTGIQTNLTQESYEFMYDEDIEDRFLLFFTTVSVSDIENDFTTIFSYEDKVSVIISSEISPEIIIYNLFGQKVSQITGHKGINEIPVHNSGYYLVNVIDNNQMTTKKVFIK